MALAVIDGSLRGLGLVAGSGLAMALWKYRKAMRSSCDAACAAAVMPADAYKGRVVWITGASSGIGKELAVQLAKHGAKLILSARRKEVLEAVARDLQPALDKSGGEVRVLAVDLEDLAALPGKAQEALAFFDGVIDVLVNNGGYSSRALAKDTDGIKEEITMMNVNFLSCVALAKAVAPAMRERKRGWIINISSMAGKFGVPLRTLYCGAKHALIGWFDAFRAEEQGFWGSGIVTTNVCPGSVKTDVAVNAVTASGDRRGFSDPNIDNGLDVSFVCDRILAASYCGLDEVWIAKAQELQGAYVNQFFPNALKASMRDKAKLIVGHTMGKEFVQSRL